jgi:hypothetical protein
VATGIYSTSRPATVDVQDVEIYYTYAPSREQKPSALVKLDASQVLESVKDPLNTAVAFGGMYQLALPAEHFNKKGIYNVYIRPMRIRGVIEDCGAHAAIPNLKGIVLNPVNFNDMDNRSLATLTNKIKNGGLVGYRVEYYDEVSGVQQLRENHFTIVTSSNKCEGVTQNIGNSTQRSTAYTFNDGGNLMFLTVTPSTAPVAKPNQLPDIGVKNQEIVLHNPYFDPTMVEVELTEYDIESLAIFMAGEQSKSMEDGVITWYKTDGAGNKQIYKQSTVSQIKNEYNETLFEIKENLDDIDNSKNWSDITDDLQ